MLLIVGELLFHFSAVRFHRHQRFALRLILLPVLFGLLRLLRQCLGVQFLLLLVLAKLLLLLRQRLGVQFLLLPVLAKLFRLLRQYLGAFLLLPLIPAELLPLLRQYLGIQFLLGTILLQLLFLLRQRRSGLLPVFRLHVLLPGIVLCRVRCNPHYTERHTQLGYILPPIGKPHLRVCGFVDERIPYGNPI